MHATRHGEHVVIKLVGKDYRGSVDLLLDLQQQIPGEETHVIPVLDSWLVAQGTYIVMPRLEPLDECRALPIHTVVSLAQQLLSGIRFLHQNKIVHRDLKPANIVIDRHRVQLFIIDFDLAERYKGKDDVEVGFTGSVGFTAPEVGEPDYCKDTTYRMVPADLWATGKLLNFLVTLSGDIASIRLNPLKDVASRMMDHDPSLRLSADDALAMLIGENKPGVVVRKQAAQPAWTN